MRMYLSAKRAKLQMYCNVADLPSADRVLTYEWVREYNGGATHLPAELSYTGVYNQTLVISVFSSLYHIGDYHCLVGTRAGRELVSNVLQLRNSE